MRHKLGRSIIDLVVLSFETCSFKFNCNIFNELEATCNGRSLSLSLSLVKPYLMIDNEKMDGRPSFICQTVQL